jgi:nucleotide-binding universal stress UspA family protein
VVGVPDPRFGEEALAWIKLRAGQSATEAEIRQFCRARLAHFKTPRYIKFVDRFPAIVYVGAAVLAWTAAKMMMSEPLIKDYFTDQAALGWMIYATVIGGVLGAGTVVNRRRLSLRVAAHVVDLAATPAAGSNAGSSTGVINMLKVLVPVDGSENSQQAVRHVIHRYLHNRALEVHLLHVRTRLSRHMARFLNKRDLAAWHRQQADKALQPARALLDSFGVPHACHVELGDKAATIDRVARRLRAGQIVIGTARKNSLTRLIQDSVANQVIEASVVPVEVVAGREVSAFERYGVPAGVGTAFALLLIAAD